MTEIEGVQFESAKVIPPGAKLVFKVPPTTNQEQFARLSEKLAKHFDGHDVIVLRDCELHAIEPQPVAHEVPGFHMTYPAWSDCIGNAMPFTPFQADEPGPGFICGESFLREALPKYGMTPDQIETYIAGLPRLRLDEEAEHDNR
jgi:hypothetical protein